jgi:hypothetical protein
LVSRSEKVFSSLVGVVFAGESVGDVGGGGGVWRSGTEREREKKFV